MITILVDTSFLISLADRTRAHHTVAVRYFRESLRRDATLYLSTLVAAEFQVKQAVTDLPLRNFVVLPFNIDHAMTAGDLVSHVQRDSEDRRDVVKEDLKIIAQAICGSITHILTEDENTLSKYVDRVRADRNCSVSVILLKNGFDESHFNDGQRGLIEEEPPE